MELKGLLSNYEAVRTEIEGAKKKPGILQEKIKSANKRLAELESAITSARGKKEQALVAFASGDITETELKTARSSLEKLLSEKTEVEEFLIASEKANQRLQKMISDLSVKLNGCRHEFWNGVAAEFKNKITGDVIAQVHAIFAARSLAGGVGSYESFLQQVFPMLPLDENQKVQEELIEKYGFKE